MSKNNNKHNEKDTAGKDASQKINVENADAAVENDVVDGDTLLTDDDDASEVETLKNMLQQSNEALEKQKENLEKEKKEYLFLMAEFDNFKKRTLREKAEIIKNGAENVLKGILPILDDFERGIAAIKDDASAQSVKEGMELIYNKFVKYLQQNGVREIPTENAEFDVDLHEAIAMVPVDDESKKGKVIDTIAKGYTLNDKVIRHAKVAVGQ